MSDVQVWCPNGYRVVVQTTPNTKVLQVLDEVCVKQRFLPSTDYELRHNQKPLNVSHEIHSSTIPNHAKLDLIKAKQSRVETDVFVKVQASDGWNSTREFKPTTSLWEILESFEIDDGRGGHPKLLHSRIANEEPVCLYVKDEFVGEYILRETTLRTLGLVTGRAALRVHFKTVTPEQLEAMNHVVATEKNRLARLYAIASAQQSIDSQSLSNVIAPVATSPAPVSQTGSITSSADPEPLADTGSVVSPAAPLSGTGGGVSEGKGKRVPKSESVPVNADDTGVLANQVNKSFHQTETEGREVQASNTSADSTPLPIPDTSAHYTPLYLRSSEPGPSGLSSSSVSPPGGGTRHQSPFVDFKFPEETKGKAVYNNELSDFKKEDCQPCDREVVVYNVNESSGEENMEVEEVSDEFYKHTDADVRYLQSDLQKKAKEVSDQPLLTTAMRRAQLKEKASRYTVTIIRVQFPDGNVLQGVFKPFETVYALYKFVREHLQDDTLEFELFTPPKIHLKDPTSTLAEAELVPLAVVYFSLPFKLNQYLSDDIMCNISTKLSANEVKVKHMPSTSNSVGDSRITSGASSGTSAGASHNQSSAERQRGANSSGTKYPKWFKPGK